MTANQRKVAQGDARRLLGQRIFNATVDSTSGGLIRIRRLHQSDPDGQFYPAASGLAAAVSPGDLVLCVAVGGTVQVLEKIVTS